jgi:hypothetical protein
MGLVLNLGHNGSSCPSAADIDGEFMDVDENPFSPDYAAKEETMVIVDTNGVFSQRVRWCACPDQLRRDMVLFRMGLFPATLDKPKTAFTFQLLDYFHLDQMECKTSASNFFNKLRRITNPTFPHKVPVCDILILYSMLLTIFPFVESISRIDACLTSMALLKSPHEVRLWP